MLYNFNPRATATQTAQSMLGQPGTAGICLGTTSEDPKFQGPCGEEYYKYVDCLKFTQFNRVQCRPAENQVISCEKTKLKDNSKQLQILANWRKNKGKRVKRPYVFDEDEEEEAKNKQSSAQKK